MRHHARQIAAACLAGAALGVAPAQTGATCFHLPDNGPGAGLCNTVPFGTGAARSAKYQTLVPPADLGSAPIDICSLAFAPCGSGTRAFATLEVVIGYFPGPGTTLSTTFASNLTGARTVLQVRDHHWHTTADAWNRIGLQESFRYDPTNGPLVVQLTMTDAARFGGTGSSGFRRGASHQRLYAVGWTSAPPASGLRGIGALKMQVCDGDGDLALFGIGCVGSNRLAPRLGLEGSARLNGTFRASIGDALPDALTVLVFGITNTSPIDLPFAAGCKLYQRSVLSVGLRADAQGSAVLPVTVPGDPALVCGRIYVQWLALDAAANMLGVTSTNYGRVLIGR